MLLVLFSRIFPITFLIYSTIYYSSSNMGRHDADLPNCLLFLYCSMIISAVHAEFGPNLEKVFDIIGAWRVAEMVREVKGLFLHEATINGFACWRI